MPKVYGLLTRGAQLLGARAATGKTCDEVAGLTTRQPEHARIANLVPGLTYVALVDGMMLLLKTF